jgi:hypothetical protein
LFSQIRISSPLPPTKKPVTLRKPSEEPFFKLYLTSGASDVLDPDPVGPTQHTEKKKINFIVWDALSGGLEFFPGSEVLYESLII